MKKNILFLLPVALLLSCNSVDTKSLIGNWMEVLPADAQYVQGVTLNADGTAQSIGMATLLYEKWKVEENKMILSGKSLGNGQTIEFSDTMKIVKITPDTLTLGQIKYYKVTEIPSK